MRFREEIETRGVKPLKTYSSWKLQKKGRLFWKYHCQNKNLQGKSKICAFYTVEKLARGLKKSGNVNDSKHIAIWSNKQRETILKNGHKFSGRDVRCLNGYVKGSRNAKCETFQNTTHFLSFEEKLFQSFCNIIAKKISTITICWPTSLPRKNINTPWAIQWLTRTPREYGWQHNGKGQEGKLAKQLTTTI